ncbi:MAG: ATP-binding protein [Pirellulaceae bacterium]|jgi:signal transduction histidine kinase|nr:ATP-binding protein [Pirellulaceae bacterium]
MSYRSIKRVLGETSLERKCRLLFGACLLLLITGAFWGVDRIAGNLVMTNTRNHGHDLIDIIMIKVHSLRFETRGGEAVPEDSQKRMNREWLQEIIVDFEESQDYRYDIVTLDADYWLNHVSPTTPQDNVERELLKELDRKFQQQKGQVLTEAEKSSAPLTPERALGEVAERPRRPVYVDRLPEQAGGEYHYFEPVYFKKTCRFCHTAALDVGTLSAAEVGESYAQDPPLLAVKVILPYADTAEAISNSRAILIAVAILTVFVAMIALYLIVRYVIVKPLQHLRDVSDDVSRGKLEVRADIHTNDEFEDLAQSFNRMLRHLTDAQAELRRVNRDLDGKVDELAQLNMRLYEMNRLKDDFLANMSHELRTPLNSIIGFSEVLQGIESLNDKQKRYAANIQKSGRVLLEMINDILDLAKLEAGKMEVRPTEFRIDTVVHAQCDMVRSLAEDKNIDLVVEVDRNLPAVYQDQAKVQQILTNLLSNAIKFTPEGGRIDVFAGHDRDGRLLLSVADTGVGVAEEDRDIIFEKFRQSGSILGEDGLSREYSGTGLGLSILKELCKLLQGEISFESELGRGSTFTVVLPWVAADRSPRETKLNMQLHDLAAPGVESFSAARPSPSAGLRSNGPDAAT